MNVLFVSESRFSQAPFRDTSARYRCYHMAEALHALGYLADVTTLDDLHVANLSRYDVLCVQQPTASRKLLNVLDRAQKLKIRTVADLDALEFDPLLAAESPKSQLEEHSVATTRAAFMRKSLALQHFDEVCAATEELARARRVMAPSQPVYVVPNGLSNFWLSSHDHIQIKPSQLHRIAYFSDNRCMNSEFEVCASSVKQYLEVSRNRELFVIGPLVVSHEDFPAAQINRGEWIEHMSLPQSLTQCRVSLAPHKDNRINNAQPHTRFIEAAAFGVPTISSPTTELLEHDVPGLIIAHDETQWLAGLEALADDEFYRHSQQALYDYAREHCLAEHSAQILIRQWSVSNESINNENTTRLSATG